MNLAIPGRAGLSSTRPFTLTRMLTRMPEPIPPYSRGRLARCLLLFVFGAACVARVARAETEAPLIWLDTLDIARVQQDWGEPGAGRSVGRNPMSMQGKQYPHGLGTHAFSECHVELFASCERFCALAGIDDEVGSNGSVVFEVWVDGVRRWASPVVRGGEAPVPVEIELSGARHLLLVVEPTADGIHLDHANWADARLYLTEDAAQLPRVIAPPIELPECAESQPRKPETNAPRVIGATPGRPFLYRIPCAGERPIRFEADGLPPDLTLDSATGILRGSLAETGIHEIRLRASNRRGRYRFSMLLVAAPDSLALTPPMGWNSWNIWGDTVNEERVRDAANALLDTRLADYGFHYVCIDDGWAGGRDAQGSIVPNDRFPAMPGLLRQLHEMGLKAGIYTSPGRTTCAEYEGSYGHEHEDARTFAAWGVDFLKYDWCSYSGLAQGEGREIFVRPYRIMRRALDDCGRDVLYALCQYGMGEVWDWAASPDVRGNQWRTTEDISDTWASMLHNALATAAVAEFAGPGRWNDADMLVLGTLGWGRPPRETRLNPREQQTHVALWAMLPSPMILGCDLTRLDAFTLALLRNPEVVALHQDPLGAPVQRITGSLDAPIQVWSRPLWDGTHAVGLFNFSNDRTPREIEASWADLGLTATRQPVRDLWRRQKLGNRSGGIAMHIPPRGCALLKIGRPMKDAAAMSALRRRYEERLNEANQSPSAALITR